MTERKAKQIPCGDDRKKQRQESKAKGCAVRSLICLTLYFYFSELSGINLQRLFREFAFCFPAVAGSSTDSGA
jgi:hypothetical protein